MRECLDIIDTLSWTFNRPYPTLSINIQPIIDNALKWLSILQPLTLSKAAMTGDEGILPDDKSSSWASLLRTPTYMYIYTRFQRDHRILSFVFHFRVIVAGTSLPMP